MPRTTDRQARRIVAALCVVVAIEILLGLVAYKTAPEWTDRAMQGPAEQRIPALRRLASRGDGSGLAPPVWISVARNGDLETRTYLLWLSGERVEWEPQRNRLHDGIEPAFAQEVALLSGRPKRLADLQVILDAHARIREHDRTRARPVPLTAQ